MNELPTGARGKALALALIALAIAAVYLVVVAPLAGLYADNREQLDDRLALALRLTRSVQVASNGQAADEAPPPASEQDLLLDGESDSVAAANLQSTVKDLVEGAGARLISSEVLPPEKRETLQRVGIHVSFSGNLALLTNVLQGIQSAHPVIVVDNVDISADATGQDVGGQKQLAIGLNIYGFKPLQGG